MNKESILSATICRLSITTVAILTSIFALGCSRSQIPAGAHVQDLGVVRLNTQSPTPIPLSGDVSHYCVPGSPEQLAKKVELSMKLKKSADGSLWVVLHNTPTPADYARLSFKHGEFLLESGGPFVVKISEKAWIRFTPIQESL